MPHAHLQAAWGVWLRSHPQPPCLVLSHTATGSHAATRSCWTERPGGTGMGGCPSWGRCTWALDTAAWISNTGLALRVLCAAWVWGLASRGGEGGWGESFSGPGDSSLSPGLWLGGPEAWPWDTVQLDHPQPPCSLPGIAGQWQHTEAPFRSRGQVSRAGGWVSRLLQMKGFPNSFPEPPDARQPQGPAAFLPSALARLRLCGTLRAAAGQPGSPYVMWGCWHESLGVT